MNGPFYSTLSKKIEKGKFHFAFDVRPGQEVKTGALRQEWSEKKKDVNNSCVSEKKSKESEIQVVEDYFQIKVVYGEIVLVPLVGA